MRKSDNSGLDLEAFMGKITETAHMGKLAQHPSSNFPILESLKEQWKLDIWRLGT